MVAYALPVAHAPIWAAELLGEVPLRARVGSDGRRVIYEFVTAKRARSRMVVPAAPSRDRFQWTRVTLQREQKGSVPVRTQVVIKPHIRQAIHHDAWVLNAVFSTSLPEQYTPTARERQLVGLLGPLSDPALELPDLSALGAELSDPYLRGLALCFAIARHQWDTVFEHSSAKLPSWAAPILGVLDGDLATLRRLAHEQTSSLSGLSTSPLLHVTGTAFGTTGHEGVGVELLSRALDGLEPLPRAAGLLQLAQLLRRQQLYERARKTLRLCVLLGDTDRDLLRRAGLEFARVDAIEDAYLVLQRCYGQAANDVAAGLAFVQILCCCGELDRAERILDRLEKLEPARSELLRWRGAIAVERGRNEQAISDLTRLTQMDPEDAEGRTWLCEALLRNGDSQRAQRELDLARARVDTFAHVLLQGALTPLHALAEAPELAAVMEALGTPLDIAACHNSRERYPARPQILEVLRTLGTGRGHILVQRLVATPGPASVRVLQMCWQGSAARGRQAASDTLKSIVRRPAHEVMDEFDATIAEHGGSPHPWCYRGELRLWLGDYAGALADFDRASQVQPVRWAYIGRAALHALARRAQAAREEIAQCDLQFDPLPSSTAHIYCGEMDRRMGNVGRAIEALEECVRVKPGRISGWMNLALAYLVEQRVQEAQTLFESIYAKAPRLLWDARRQLAQRGPHDVAWPPRFEDIDPLFETALVMMRGNRSSHCATYFDIDGVLRRVYDAQQWAATIDKMRFYLWAETCSQLARGAP